MIGKMNLGQLVSLIHCKECGMPIEIYTSEEEKKECPNCKKMINLIYDFDNSGS